MNGGFMSANEFADAGSSNYFLIEVNDIIFGSKEICSYPGWERAASICTDCDQKQQIVEQSQCGACV